MLQVQCPGCMTSAYIECSCPPEVQAGPTHLPGCPVADPDAQVTCVPGHGCCAEDHDHAAAANSCPGGHGDCPEPDACRTWAGMTADTRHPQYAGPPAGPCPGGHCHKDIDGCTVCRPLIITILPGTRIQTVGG